MMLADQAQVVHVRPASDALDHRIVVWLDLEQHRTRMAARAVRLVMVRHAATVNSG